MPGKPKQYPNKSQAEEIAAKKEECVRFYELTGIKQAAADWVGRTLKTINDWEQADEDFRYRMLRAKATYMKTNARRTRPDNVLAHLYDEYKPPKQEIAVDGPPSTVNITYVLPSDHQPEFPVLPACDAPADGQTALDETLPSGQVDE